MRPLLGGSSLETESVLRQPLGRICLVTRLTLPPEVIGSRPLGSADALDAVAPSPAEGGFGETLRPGTWKVRGLCKSERVSF